MNVHTPWQVGGTYTIGPERVEISAPRLVSRSRGYHWFPAMERFADGSLVAIINDYRDDHVEHPTEQLTFSRDSGWTWTPPVRYDHCEQIFVTLESGDLMLLPYHMIALPEGMGGAYKVIRQRTHEVETHDAGVIVTGWARGCGTRGSTHFTNFSFHGQSLRARDGRYLATLYGCYEGTTKNTVVLAESTDGLRWRVISTVAPDTYEHACADGPSESALVRLADGRLMCIYRITSFQPMGASYSDDDGRTWTQPRRIEPYSVQPSATVMSDGTIWMTAGRAGLFLYHSADKAGETWASLDLMAHHNAHCDERIEASAVAWEKNTTSAYTEIIALDDRTLLCMYDRVPAGWAAIPDDMDDTNSIWVVRVRRQ